VPVKREHPRAVKRNRRRTFSRSRGPLCGGRDSHEVIAGTSVPAQWPPGRRGSRKTRLVEETAPERGQRKTIPRSKCTLFTQPSHEGQPSPFANAASASKHHPGRRPWPSRPAATIRVGSFGSSSQRSGGLNQLERAPSSNSGRALSQPDAVTR
jgi:hypothetical protein